MPASSSEGSTRPPKKKKKVDEAPGQSGYWIDTDFAYTPEQQAAILEALPTNPGGLTTVHIIQERARAYRGEVVHKKEPPLPRDVQQQLQQLRLFAENLLDCLETLHDQTRDVLSGVAAKYGHSYSEGLSVKGGLRQLETLLNFLYVNASWAHGTYAPKKGRPRKSPRRIFVEQLYETWMRCGNLPPKRRHDPQSGQDYGPFHSFVEACASSVIEMRGLDRVIREVLAANGQK